MKYLKKVLVATLVLSLVLSTVAYAATKQVKVINFENGKIPACIFMKTDDGGDLSKLSVVKFNGSKQLFVKIKDGMNKVPKLQINIGDLVGAKNMEKVRTFKMKVTIVNPKKKEIAWNGGGWGANIGKDGKTWYQDPNQWVLEEYKKSVKEMEYQVTFVKGMGFTNGVLPGSCLFMKWAGNECNMYIDNIEFLDKNGKAIAINLNAKKTKDKK